MPKYDEDFISNLMNQILSQSQKKFEESFEVLQKGLRDDFHNLEVSMARRISRLEDRAYDKAASQDTIKKRGLVADTDAFSGTSRWVGDNYRVR